MVVGTTVDQGGTSPETRYSSDKELSIKTLFYLSRVENQTLPNGGLLRITRSFKTSKRTRGLTPTNIYVSCGHTFLGCMRDSECGTSLKLTQLSHPVCGQGENRPKEDSREVDKGGLSSNKGGLKFKKNVDS